MAQPREMVSVEALNLTAEALIAIASSMTKVSLMAREAGMTEVLLPWTNANWKAVDKLAETGPLLEAAASMEVTAFKTGRQSTAMLEKIRAARDNSRRKPAEPSSRKADAATPPKRRGRPKKKPE